jgi:hypothetical protein
MTQLGENHFVACHHPLEPGEIVTTVEVTGATA